MLMGVEKVGRKNIFQKFVEPFVEGDIFSKLSYVIWGLGNIVRGQVVKGLAYLALEIGYFYYMVTFGFQYILDMRTLGTQEQGMVYDEAQGIMVVVSGDNSMLILLWGVVSIVITLVAIAVWITSIRSGENARQLRLKGKQVPGLLAEARSLLDDNIYRLFLAGPVVGILTFTVTPLIYMILIAFTNYDVDHQPPGNLFTWVGLENFKLLFSSSESLSGTFWPILGWTFVWGITATFSCYFLGIFLALLINSKGIRLKKFWRTCFVMTMAIPSFISLLVVGTMLGSNGIINVLLQNWGFTTSPLPFLTDGTWAKVTVIVVNIWIGIPVTMLMVTGILMNIPAELYESARLDGASPFMQFRKITFPYMLFTTTPYLITNFIGNLNNFGVIYFLTGGAPNTLDFYKGAGRTDLLVTWLYKLTKDSRDYNLAAAIGIVIFVICATFSLITYSRSRAVRDEEGFQ